MLRGGINGLAAREVQTEDPRKARKRLLDPLQFLQEYLSVSSAASARLFNFAKSIEAGQPAEPIASITWDNIFRGYAVRGFSAGGATWVE
jgi:hypothetical protein